MVKLDCSMFSFSRVNDVNKVKLLQLTTGSSVIYFNISVWNHFSSLFLLRKAWRLQTCLSPFYVLIKSKMIEVTIVTFLFYAPLFPWRSLIEFLAQDVDKIWSQEILSEDCIVFPCKKWSCAYSEEKKNSKLNNFCNFSSKVEDSTIGSCLLPQSVGWVCNSSLL